MERTLKVTGKGNVKIKPDLTIIQLSFTGVGKEYAETLEKSVGDVAEIKDMLIQLGFNKNELKTTYFNVNSEYESYKDEKGNYCSKFVGYRYNQTLKFSFDIDNKILGKVLFALSRVKTHPKFDIIYSVKNVEEAKNLLLKDAVKDANNKADIIAKASNVELGSILNIDYSFINIEFSSRMINSDCAMLYNKCSSVGSYDIDIEPDDIEASDSITLIYAIS